MFHKFIIGYSASHILTCHKVIVCITRKLSQQQHATNCVTAMIDKTHMQTLRNCLIITWHKYSMVCD